MPPLRTSLHRLLPGFGNAHRFNGDVDAAILRRERARLADGLANARGLHHVRRAQLARRFHLAVVLDDGDHFAAGQRGDVQNHQAQRAAADDRDGVAGMRPRIFKSVHGAGQRLGQRRVFQRNVVGNMQRVLGDDARRNANELGIGAVVEEQIVAEIFLAALAEVALAAGRGVERDDAVAGSEIRRLPRRPRPPFRPVRGRREPEAQSCARDSRGERPSGRFRT